MVNKKNSATHVNIKRWEIEREGGESKIMV